VEEDVATPTGTVVTDDGSWIGRTIVTLVILALLVAGAVWLVRALSDNNGSSGNPDVHISGNVNVNPGDNSNGNNNTQPSGVLPS
jgi:flagellar biogenesis protein FliO